mgnify:CR=1 FL=1
MKKLALLILVMGCAAGAFAQNATNEKTLFERVTQIEKKMDWFNFYLNMQGSFDASFNYDQSGLSEAAFKMRQFRIEAHHPLVVLSLETTSEPWEQRW